jgi:hypothetical protein
VIVDAVHAWAVAADSRTTCRCGNAAAGRFRPLGADLHMIGAGHMSHRTNVSLPLLLPWHRSNDQLLRVDSWHGCFARRSDCVTDDQRHLMRRTPRPQFNRVDSIKCLVERRSTLFS